jgi:hypothetical protein
MTHKKIKLKLSSSKFKFKIDNFLYWNILLLIFYLILFFRIILFIYLNMKDVRMDIKKTISKFIFMQILKNNLLN